MPDITMCSGEGCEKKDTCYRYLAEPDKYRQAYFLKPPLKHGSCDYYWEQCPKCKQFDGKHKIDCYGDINSSRFS